VGNEGEKERGRSTADAADFVFPLPLPFQPGMPLWQLRVSIQSAAAPQCFHSLGVFCEPSSCYKIHIPSLRRHSPVPLLLCCHGLELGQKSWCKQTQAGRPCDVDNLCT